MTASDWTFLDSARTTTLSELFAADGRRVEALSLGVGGIWFDWSKTHLAAPVLSGFERLAAVRKLPVRRDDLFCGRIVNPTEGRAAEHSAERGEGAAESVQRAKAFHGRMRSLIDAIEAGALGEIRHILHIGIGGSALGPNLLVDALGREAGRYDVAIVSNVDGSALKEVFDRFDPHKTLLAVASKPGAY